MAAISFQPQYVKETMCNAMLKNKNEQNKIFFSKTFYYNKF